MTKGDKDLLWIWRDKNLYGFAAMDEHGNRIDPTLIRPMSPTTFFDLPKKDEISKTASDKGQRKFS